MNRVIGNPDADIYAHTRQTLAAPWSGERRMLPVKVTCLLEESVKAWKSQRVLGTHPQSLSAAGAPRLGPSTADVCLTLEYTMPVA
jgi:hypothetical protein